MILVVTLVEIIYNIFRLHTKIIEKSNEEKT